MERKAIQPDKIVIREFRLVKGQLDSPYDFRVGNIKSFDFNVSLNAGVNLDENLVRAEFQITIKTVSEEKAVEASADYSITFIYFLEDLNEHVMIMENDEIDWNPYLANAIASITYSTTRGILWSRFQGTVMEKFILPVVDPNQLIKSAQPQVIEKKDL